jgi:hypothetical protein
VDSNSEEDDASSLRKKFAYFVPEDNGSNPEPKDSPKKTFEVYLNSNEYNNFNLNTKNIVSQKPDQRLKGSTDFLEKKSLVYEDCSGDFENVEDYFEKKLSLINSKNKSNLVSAKQNAENSSKYSSSNEKSKSNSKSPQGQHHAPTYHDNTSDENLLLIQKLKRDNESLKTQLSNSNEEWAQKLEEISKDNTERVTTHISRNQQALDSCRSNFQRDQDNMTDEMQSMRVELEQEKAINSELNMQKKAKATVGCSTGDLEENLDLEREALESNFVK